MNWITVMKGSSGPLMMSLWSEQRAQNTTQIMMMSGQHLNLSSPYLQ